VGLGGAAVSPSRLPPPAGCRGQPTYPHGMAGILPTLYFCLLVCLVEGRLLTASTSSNSREADGEAVLAALLGTGSASEHSEDVPHIAVADAATSHEDAEHPGPASAEIQKAPEDSSRAAAISAASVSASAAKVAASSAAAVSASAANVAASPPQSSGAGTGSMEISGLGEALAERVLKERRRLQKENREMQASLASIRSSNEAKASVLSTELEKDNQKASQLMKALQAAKKGSKRLALSGRTQQSKTKQQPSKPVAAAHKKQLTTMDLQLEVKDLKFELVTSELAAGQEGNATDKLRGTFVQKVQSLEDEQNHLADLIMAQKNTTGEAADHDQKETAEVTRLTKKLANVTSVQKTTEQNATELATALVTIKTSLKKEVQDRKKEESHFDSEEKRIRTSALAKIQKLEDEREKLHDVVRKASANSSSLLQRLIDERNRIQMVQKNIAHVKDWKMNVDNQLNVSSTELAEVRGNLSSAQGNFSQAVAQHKNETRQLHAAATGRLKELQDEHDKLKKGLAKEKGQALISLRKFHDAQAAEKQLEHKQETALHAAILLKRDTAVNKTALAGRITRNITKLQQELSNQKEASVKEGQRKDKVGQLLQGRDQELVTTRRQLNSSRNATSHDNRSKTADEVALLGERNASNQTLQKIDKEWSIKVQAQKDSAEKVAKAEQKSLTAENTTLAAESKAESTVRATLDKLHSKTAIEEKSVKQQNSDLDHERSVSEKEESDERAKLEAKRSDEQKRVDDEKAKLDGEVQAAAKRESDAKALHDGQATRQREAQAAITSKENEMNGVKSRDVGLLQSLSSAEARGQDLGSQVQRLKTENEVLRGANSESLTATQRAESDVSALGLELQQARASESAAVESVGQAAKVQGERDTLYAQLQTSEAEANTWKQAEARAHGDNQTYVEQTKQLSSELGKMRGEDDRHKALLQKLLGFSKTQQEKMQMLASVMTPEQQAKLTSITDM